MTVSRLPWQYALLLCLARSCFAEDLSSKAPAVVASTAPAPDQRASLTQSAIQGKPPTEAAELASPPLPSSVGSFTLLFRNYVEDLDVIGIRQQHAWVQAVQAIYESPYTQGPIGFGFDVAPFAAIKLDGGRGARNMINQEPDGSGYDNRAWAYLGMYGLKARALGVNIKYGLQAMSNPYMEPYDIRALPPTYRGWSLWTDAVGGVSLKAGSFDAVNARGATKVQPLSTSYGETPFNRLSFIGIDWVDGKNSKSALYLAKAQDLWRQYYVSAESGIGNVQRLKGTLRADAYVTRDEGQQLQGPIRNTAYSVSASLQHSFSTVSVGYQRIIGNQYFDFMNETSGIYLSNSVGVDYNAPGERSLQLRYNFDGAGVGIPGLQLSFWTVRGWKADGSAEACTYSTVSHPLHSLYWKNGRAIGGDHKEYGMQAKYRFQHGVLKNGALSYVFIQHSISPDYPSKDFRIHRLTMNIPVQIF